MTEDQIKHMVGRFLSWRLPENFNPDGGISFKRTFNDWMTMPQKYEPSGTNLLDATQATAMVRHMLKGLPTPPPVQAVTREELVEIIQRSIPIGQRPLTCDFEAAADAILSRLGETK